VGVRVFALLWGRIIHQMSWKKTFWLIGLWGMAAQAVCVNGHPSVVSEFRPSKAVVLATVTEEKQLPQTRDLYFLDGKMYQVNVEKRFKGDISPTFDIFSENTSGRFDMKTGESYLLFIYEVHGRFEC
jgi:hypothetical protein